MNIVIASPRSTLTTSRGVDTRPGGNHRLTASVGRHAPFRSRGRRGRILSRPPLPGLTSESNRPDGSDIAPTCGAAARTSTRIRASVLAGPVVEQPDGKLVAVGAHSFHRRCGGCLVRFGPALLDPVPLAAAPGSCPS